jgi:hypothetical protein
MHPLRAGRGIHKGLVFVARGRGLAASANTAGRREDDTGSQKHTAAPSAFARVSRRDHDGGGVAVLEVHITRGLKHTGVERRVIDLRRKRALEDGSVPSRVVGRRLA